MHTTAIKDWKQSYDPALKVVRGQSVTVHKKDDTQWQGWLWCSDAAGLSGWLPDTVFKGIIIGMPNTVIHDFDTVELTVTRGEPLHTSNPLNDWSWCENAAGHCGWVLDTCLALSTEPS